jgi:hypothetical protein
MGRYFMRFAGLTLLAWFAATTGGHAQVTTGVGAAYNPYTGRSATAQTAYNPYTGARGASTSSYNPYTGRDVQTKEAYNPYTGREGVERSVSNPYTGRSTSSYAYRRR